MVPLLSPPHHFTPVWESLWPLLQIKFSYLSLKKELCWEGILCSSFPTVLPRWLTCRKFSINICWKSEQEIDTRSERGQRHRGQKSSISNENPFLSISKLSYCAVLSRVSRVQLCNPMDCSPPGSSVHGILQARILEWVAMPSSRGSSQPRDRTQILHHLWSR